MSRNPCTRRNKRVYRNARHRGGAINDADEQGRTALFKAAESNDLSKVIELIAAGADVNKSDNIGTTPLHVASVDGYLEVVDALIAAGADINKADKKGITPFYYASQDGHLEIMELLIKSGADINKADNDGATPLYVASQYSQLEVVDALIAAGADINKANMNGETPLHVATIDGYLEFVDALIAAGADINKADKKGITPFYHAVQQNDLEIMELLIKSGADVNKADNDGATPLHVASLNGHLEVVDALIAAGADINKSDNIGETPLFIASLNQHLEVVDMLITAGADIDKSDNISATPLHVATINGYLEIVKRLIAAGADVNKERTDTGATPLFSAIVKGHVEIIDRLIAAHADVNKATTISNMTPLYKAAQIDNIQVLDKLIAADADVNKTTDEGQTPLYVASARGNLNSVKRLIAAGANVNKTKNTGESPLFISCKLAHVKIVEELLKVPGIDIALVKREISNFSHEIQAILKIFIKTSSPLWPGFSRSDSEKLGLLFEEKIHSNTLTLKPVGAEEVLYSHCPICLKYISHDEATCMYMSHNCTELGGFYHEELFNKYKHRKVNALGVYTNTQVIAWCTLCGRICKGHQHYELDSYKTKNPTLLKGGAPYETDCRKTNGGGGWPEKAARHKRLREYALELNEKVGKITTQEALEQLVEEMWNAPLRREGRVLGRMEAEKKYTNIAHNEFPNVPYNRFPNAPNNTVFQQAELTNTAFKVASQTFLIKNDELYTNNTTKADAPYQYFYQQFKKGVQPIPNIAYPNNADPELKPIVHTTAPVGYKDPISPDYPDTENIVQFRHRNADGMINNHANPAMDMIAKDSLFGMLSSALNNAELSKIGPCWKAECTALIYPQELKAIIDAAEYPGAAGSVQKEADMKVYEQYRHAFNKKYKRNS